MDLITANPEITIYELMDISAKSKTTVQKCIKRLKDEGIIERIGPDKGDRWKVVE